MIEVVLGIGVVVIASCQNSYGVDVAVCACLGEGVEGARCRRLDGGVIGGGRLDHGAAWLHVRRGNVR